ncbi:MAG: DNA repair protein RadC, partial [Deltaproteobacteria bacterium]|nr:DNA repair protein RadC [Deltaproteobacteria bacterium]
MGARKAPQPLLEENCAQFRGPRERLLEGGARHLDDTELVAVILGTGRAGEPVLDLAARLLRETGGLAGLASISPSALSSYQGLGEAKAARLAAAIELGARVTQSAPPPTRISDARDIDALLRSRLAYQEIEHFVALAIDGRHRLVRELWLAKGTMTACLVSLAHVFRQLLLEAVPVVAFAHNHPSGEPEPSPEDIDFTRRLASAAELFGLRLLDHVIVSRKGYWSFRQAGLLASFTPIDKHIS